MQPRVGNSLNREHGNRNASVIRHGFAGEQSKSLMAHPAQQQRFRFEDSELPGPISTRTLKTFAPLFRFVLSLLQIAVQEGLVGVIVIGLRAARTATAQPASKE
jgi:hypothetical protein